MYNYRYVCALVYMIYSVQRIILIKYIRIVIMILYYNVFHEYRNAQRIPSFFGLYSTFQT